MKITKRNLKKLIETFIVDPEGRTIDYDEIIRLEKEYSETHDPEILKMIDNLKADYINHPDYLSIDLDKFDPEFDPYEKQGYLQADELELVQRRDFGQNLGFDEEESEMLGDLMGRYGKERGRGDHFSNQPGKFMKSMYPSKEERKKEFLDNRRKRKKENELAKVYQKVDNLIGKYVNQWFENNKEDLKFVDIKYLHSIEDVADSIEYEIYEDKGYDDYSELLTKDPAYYEYFEEDYEKFYNAIVDKIIEYGHNNNNDYALNGVDGMKILTPNGKYVTPDSIHSGRPPGEIGYYG